MIIIGLSNAVVTCIIGCNEEERITPRDIVIDLRVKVPLAQEDTLTQTLNYEDLFSLVRKVTCETHFFLIERLASSIIEAIFEQFPAVFSVWIKVTKPQALQNVSECYVEYEKGRS